MNGEAVHASPRKTGMIILGGGLPKHHICNANMMRNGADYAVFINTAQEYDGSDSGARPDEAVSWGKLRGSAKAVKVLNLLLCLAFRCILSRHTNHKLRFQVVFFFFWINRFQVVLFSYIICLSTVISVLWF